MSLRRRLKVDDFLSVSRRRISIGIWAVPNSAHIFAVIARSYANLAFESKIAHVTTMYFVYHFYHFVVGSLSDP